MKQFKKNDWAVMEDGRLWSCVCEDDDVGIFVKVRWNKNGESYLDYETTAIYSNSNEILSVDDMNWEYCGDSLEDAMLKNWGDL